jgi:hypothetical protein
MADLGVLGGDRRSMGVDINNGGRIGFSRSLGEACLLNQEISRVG